MQIISILQFWRGKFELIDANNNILCMDKMDPRFNELSQYKAEAAWVLNDANINDLVLIIKVLI